jgi:hypothetical protein
MFEDNEATAVASKKQEKIPPFSLLGLFLPSKTREEGIWLGLAITKGFCCLFQVGFMNIQQGDSLDELLL